MISTIRELTLQRYITLHGMVNTLQRKMPMAGMRKENVLFTVAPLWDICLKNGKILSQW